MAILRITPEGEGERIPDKNYPLVAYLGQGTVGSFRAFEQSRRRLVDRSDPLPRVVGQTAVDTVRLAQTFEE